MIYCASLRLSVGYSSGQRGQTVNLLAFAFQGSNPCPTTIQNPVTRGFLFCGVRRSVFSRQAARIRISDSPVAFWYNALMKKSVLITGGTKRLGAYIAAELRTRGWRVLTSSHRADSGADIVADLARPSGAAKLYLKALELEPELSAVVNNAALFTGGADDLRSVNLESAKKLTMMLAGREDAECAVVNVLDAEVLRADAASGGGIKDVYLETKRELLEYTRKSACLFAETLRVNAVAPGPVFAPEGVHEKAGEILLARRPTAEDVASAVAFLLESPSITGAVVPVDSGQHLL